MGKPLFYMICCGRTVILCAETSPKWASAMHGRNDSFFGGQPGRGDSNLEIFSHAGREMECHGNNSRVNDD